MTTREPDRRPCPGCERTTTDHAEFRYRYPGELEGGQWALAGPTDVSFGFWRCGPCTIREWHEAQRAQGKNPFKGGHQPPSTPATAVERFWSYVRRGPECWVWTGQRNAKGYGQFHIGSATERKNTFAHRFSWKLHNGAIPDETPCVLHKCDNPPCVNPDHLFLGTKADNNRDMRDKGRAGVVPEAKRIRGEAHPDHKLSQAYVVTILQQLADGSGTSDVARRYGVHVATIDGIKHGRTWKHIPRPAKLLERIAKGAPEGETLGRDAAGRTPPDHLLAIDEVWP